MDNSWALFYVPLECAKSTSEVQLESDSPMMAYHECDQNSCCFSSLASALKATNKVSAENAFITRIYFLITGEIFDIIEFSNAVMTKEAIKKEINIYILNWNNGIKLVLLMF